MYAYDAHLIDNPHIVDNVRKEGWRGIKGKEMREGRRKRKKEKTENATNKIKPSLNSVKIAIFHV